MNILFVLFPQFLAPHTDRTQRLSWLTDFSEGLSQKGHSVTFFRPEEHKFKDFELLHFFSPVEPRLWGGLASLNMKVVVTPSLNHSPLSRWTSPLSKLLRIGRGVLQRRWPPVDDLYFAFQVKGFLPVGRAATETLIDCWAPPRKLITQLPEDPREAAKVAAAVYSS